MYDPCLSIIGGGQALTSPKRHSLGKPLPYQLADTPQAIPLAINLYSAFALHSIPSYGATQSEDLSRWSFDEIQSESGDYQVLANLSASYSWLKGMFPRVATSFAGDGPHASAMQNNE